MPYYIPALPTLSLTFMQKKDQAQEKTKALCCAMPIACSYISLHKKVFSFLVLKRSTADTILLPSKARLGMQARIVLHVDPGREMGENVKV